MSKELVGYASVDAGLIWIGDPCYVIGDDSSNGSGFEWPEFCDKLFETEGYDNGANEPLGKGVGIAVGNFGGDGSFPVYVDRDSYGRVKSATIVFEYQDDDDDYQD